MNFLPTRLLVTIAFFVTITIMKLAIKLGGGGVGPGQSRMQDIERFQLQGSEIASYDACRSALGSQQGLVPRGTYCGCLVVGGATNMQDVPSTALQTLVVANYTGALPPARVKDATVLRVSNSIEVAGSTCRHPHRQQASYEER